MVSNRLKFRENSHWTDEKGFFVKKAFNCCNTRFILKVRYPESKKWIIWVQKNPAKIMVFGLISLKTEPKNRNQFINCIEQLWTDILKPEYVRKTVAAASERVRRIVDACGFFIEALDARNPDLESSEEEDE